MAPEPKEQSPSDSVHIQPAKLRQQNKIYSPKGRSREPEPPCQIGLARPVATAIAGLSNGSRQLITVNPAVITTRLFARPAVVNVLLLTMLYRGRRRLAYPALSWSASSRLLRRSARQSLSFTPGENRGALSSIHWPPARVLAVCSPLHRP
jgi:hypothetical protein